MILVFLILLTFGCLFIWRSHVKAKNNGCTCAMREAWQEAVVILGAVQYLAIELLSLVQMLRASTVITLWLVLAVSALWLLFRNKGEIVSPLGQLLASKSSALTVSSRDPVILSALCLIIILLIFTGLTALFAAPNNGDSLAYHLPRQIFWLQQGHLGHFATTEPRMLMMPPFAETLGVQLMAVSGGDSFHNLPQYFAYITLIIQASLISATLGNNTRQQALASVLVATLPLAIHQASNTKVDLIASGLLGYLIWQMVRLWCNADNRSADWVLIGLALGMAWATKATALILSTPIMLAMGLAYLLKFRLRALVPVAVITVAALSIASWHYARNALAFGSPLGSEAQKESITHVNETLSVPAMLGNGLRNASLHLGLPHEGWNDALESAIRSVNRKLGIDPDGADTSFNGLPYDVVYRPQFETMAPQGGHLLLYLLLAGFAMARISCLSPGQRVLLITILINVILYCLLIKWQPWGARLHLPIFISCAPLAASLIPVCKRTWLPLLVTALLGIYLLPSLMSHHRPLAGAHSILTASRLDKRTYSWEGVSSSMARVAIAVEDLKIKNLEIDTPWNIPYLLMAMIRESSQQPPRFWGSTDSLAKAPEAIVKAGSLQAPLELFVEKHQATYRMVAENTIYTFYVRKDVIDSRQEQPALPIFGGWQESHGLSGIRQGMFSLSLVDAVLPTDGPQAKLLYYHSGKAQWLDFRLSLIQCQLESIYFYHNGELIYEECINKNKPVLDVELQLQSNKGLNEVSIEVEPPTKAYFYKLRITDRQP